MAIFFRQRKPVVEGNFGRHGSSTVNSRVPRHPGSTSKMFIRSGTQRKKIISQKAIIAIFCALVLIGQRLFQSNVKAHTRAKIFDWQCWDECACLPPITQDQHTITMHQSYKTNDEQTWHAGWKYQRQTWIDLHPQWFFIFWTDEQNELLAKCIGYEDIFRARSGIQKADLSRLMYLYRYGGFYSDMDYVAIKNHQPLFDREKSELKNQAIMLQGRQEQVVGFEWGFARRPQHPLWTFCLDIANRQPDSAREGCPIFFTGPKFLKRCLKKYYKVSVLENMVSYGNETMILEPKLIAPIGANDFTSECGKWRNITQESEGNIWTGDTWPKSSCKRNLVKNGTYAVTFYSHSWGEGLKC